MSPLFMADSNHRRLWSSERQIQQLGSYQMVSEPSPSTAILTTSIAPEGIAPLKIPLTEFSADLGTIIASIRHDFSRINSSLDRCIDHLNGSRATVLSESLHENPTSVYSDMVYEPRGFLHDEVTVLFSEFHTQNMPCGMCVSPGVDTDEHHNNIYNESVKEKNNHQVRSESMSSSGSIDIHETVVDTQSDSLVKILQEPQPKLTIASVLATTTESLKGVQALEIGSFENPNSTIDNGNLSCQGMEIADEKLALDSGLRGVTDMIGAKQAKLELQEVVDFLMNPNKCTELEAKTPQDCLLLPACINQQLQEMENELLHGFMTAIQQNYGDKDLIQFESFAMHNAFNLLAKYGTSHLIFNDGIQGKPSVVLTSTFLLDLRSACDVFVAMPNKVIPSYMHMGLLSFLVHELGAAVFRRRPPPEPPPIDQCLEALKTNAYCRSFSAFTFCFLFWVLYLFEEMPTRAMTFSFHMVVFDGGNNIHADLEDKVFGEGEYC